MSRFNFSVSDERCGSLRPAHVTSCHSRLLISLGLQLDWTDIESDSSVSIDGNVYVVGQHLIALLIETLCLDATAAYGQSSNNT